MSTTRTSILDELRGQGRLGDALAHILGREIPRDTTSAIQCLNPKAHNHGDAHPSAVVKPEVGRIDCERCGGAWGLFDVAVAVGFAEDRADAAAKLEKWAGYGSVVNGNGRASRPEKDFGAWHRMLRDQLPGYLERNGGKLGAGVSAALDVMEAGFSSGTPNEFHRFKEEPAVTFPAYAPDGKTIRGLKFRYASPTPKLKSRTRGPKGMIGTAQVAAKPAATVVIAAGEKDATNGLAHLPNLVWLSPSTGEGQKLGEFADMLAGRDVVILYDADQAGLEAAPKRAAELVQSAASVRIARLPLSGEPDAKDLSDWIRDNPGTADEIGAQLRELIEVAPACEATDGSSGVTHSDFYAYMVEHRYIFTPARELWPAESVNSRLPKVQVGTTEDGEPIKLSAARWLDRHRPVEQMTWAPGRPMLIEDRLIAEGGWIDRPGCAVFNLYMPPAIKPGDASKAHPWIDHVLTVYPEDAEHLIQWFAHRRQHPEVKINHALVLGGLQGVGKDTILEPVKHAVGPWNFAEIGPPHLLGRFNGFVKSVILRVSEARDLGDVNRYAFYDHLKAYTAAPPDVLRCDEKNRREYAVQNVLGVIITSNHKTDGIYLLADDRRHYVAWSDLTKDDFKPEYWAKLWGWYEAEGYHHVAAYLASVDLSGFDPKAPPTKTHAFWEIVDASRAPEDAELSDVLEGMGNPSAITLTELAAKADPSFSEWLSDRRNSRKIPHRMEEAGYVPVRSESQKDGRWKVRGKNAVIYAKCELCVRDRIKAATTLSEGSRP